MKFFSSLEVYLDEAQKSLVSAAMIAPGTSKQSEQMTQNIAQFLKSCPLLLN